jgi:hypothetical protein
MKNTVRAVLVAVLAVPALAYAQVPAAPQMPSSAAVKDAGNAAAASGKATGQAATDSASAQAKSTGQQVKDTAKTEGKKGAKTGVDAGVKKTGSVGAAAAPHAHDAAATGVDKGVDKAAEKAGIK